MSQFHSLFTLFAQVAAEQPAAEAPWHQQGWFSAVAALLVLIVPFVIGQMLAKRWRMNDYAWRIGLVLFALTAGVVVCWRGWPPKLGIDLSGGVILVYEVDQSKVAVDVGTIEARLREELAKLPDVDATVTRTPEDKIEVTLPGADVAETNRVEDLIKEVSTSDLDAELVVEQRPLRNGDRVLVYGARRTKPPDMDKLVGSIGKRVNPGGQKEVTVRKMGADRVEVIIPEVDQAEIDFIKEKISTAGALKFRILANPRSTKPEHRAYIEAAQESDLRQVRRGDEVVAEWVPIDTDSFQDVDDKNITVRETKDGQWEALVINDEFNVGGQYLSSARKGFDERGSPDVEFSFNARGSMLFGELTGANSPDPTSGVEYALGIILDDVLKSAPSLKERITNQGNITGRFTDEEVQFLVDILNAGSLPAALSKVPVAEYTSSSQLGQDTIQAGAYAMLVATGGILLFMLVYYRFAGMVADMAVLLNVVLVLALMILIKAHLTLAGLAGLVLSVGMSVDANVLIYERMREELERGSALRMAIRNGFGRAMSTIIDSNLTTLIVGIVLYIIGTDQLRGFATTLILGLMLNLFTAVYCARVVFDVAERQRWLTQLKMLKLIGKTHFNFIAWAKPAVAVSVILIAIGMVGAVYRGSGLFGIDFTGGSAVQVVFNKETNIGDVRKAVAELPDVSVSAVGSGERIERDTRFNINTSDQDIKAVEAKLQELFPGQLRTYSMEYKLAEAGSVEPTTPSDDAGTAPNDEKDEKTSDETGKKNDEAAKTGRAGPQKPDLAHAAGLIASTVPEAVLLAQAKKADAEAETKTDAESKTAPEAETAKSDPTPETPPSEAPPAEAPMAETPASENATSSEAEAESETQPDATPADGLATAELKFPNGINFAALEATLKKGLAKARLSDTVFDITSPDPDYLPGSSRPLTHWVVKTSLSPQQTETLLDTVQQQLANTPIFPTSNNIGGKVAGDTKVMATYALVVSNLLIILYVWVRFQNLVFGLAAVAALVHDVAIAVGALALSYWLAPVLGFLQVDQFKISLEVVAALLTIVGFSINDTIVIFDRIREVRGKSPAITSQIVNLSLNQTLSRTVLTSGTVFLVTLILYAAGGEGIHPFAFAMLIGVIVGSYSSLFIAAPMLLWFRKQPAGRSPAPHTTATAVPASGAA